MSRIVDRHCFGRIAILLFVGVGCTGMLNREASARQRSGYRPPVYNTAMNKTAVTKTAMAIPTPTKPMSPDLQAQAPLSEQEIRDRSIRIENQTNKPFTYQVGRTSGPMWSQPYTLPPGMAHIFTGSTAGTRPAAMSLDAQGARYIIVRFVVPGGTITYRLAASKSSTTQQEMKSYAYVLSEGGLGDLVEPPSNTGMAKSNVPLGKEDARLMQLGRNHVFKLPNGLRP